MSNTFNLSQRIRNVNGAPNLDFYYGVYQTLAQVKSTIPQNIRSLGRTVGVLDNGSVVEYWWKDGLTDEDLVKKETTSSNRVVKFTLSDLSGTSAESLTLEQFCAASVNTVNPPIQIAPNDIPFFNTVYREEFIVFTLNGVSSGVTLGQGEPNITIEQIQIISRRTLNVATIENTNPQYIDVIASVSENDNIWERVNLDEYNVQPLSQGFSVFRATVNGEELQWLYKGESGAVGLNGYQTQEDDFQLLNLSESVIPTLQQVVDASGNVVYVEFPSGTFIEDDGGSFTIQLGDSFLRINSNGSLELDAQQLILKGSNASLEGRALVVQSDGTVAWEDISVDLSDYYTKEKIDELLSQLDSSNWEEDGANTIKPKDGKKVDASHIQNLPSGYTSTDFDNDFGNKTTDDLTEGATNKYLTGQEFQKNEDDLDDITEGTTNKHFTSTEKDKLENIEENAQVNEVEEAPNDGKQYARKNEAWVETEAPTRPTPTITSGVVQVPLDKFIARDFTATLITAEQFNVDTATMVDSGCAIFRYGGNIHPSVTGATWLKSPQSSYEETADFDDSKEYNLIFLNKASGVFFWLTEINED